MVEKSVWEAVSGFELGGTPVDLQPFTRGHINSTFISSLSDGKRFLHQKINHSIFKDVPGLMQNIEVVTSHLHNKFLSSGSKGRECTLTLVPHSTGGLWYNCPDGSFWRTYDYIEGTESYDVCKNAELAKEAASSFARFTNLLSDIDTSLLCESIPKFTNTLFRYEQFEEAASRDPNSLLSSISEDASFVRNRKDISSLIVRGIESGSLPVRVAHNDTKLNNLLFDKDSGKGICVVDLDTCMPGSLLYDFGDLVRTASIHTPEDETDLTKIHIDLSYFEALVEGYLSQLELSPSELELLHIAPRIVTLTIGLRFLTDHLNGDIYFQIHRPNHNLERARSQFAYVKSMEENEANMKEIVLRYSK